MCGITGFISKEKNISIDQRTILLDKMCKIITYRGPDEQGSVVQDRAALAMRRLAIIDLKSGQQPIYTEDRNLAIVFNGEIYNFRELKKELEFLGHRFKTDSDTEVIVHAYEEFGVECLEKLRGMFAFAIWNFRDETLFLARDRVGKKPLFYGLTKDGDFVFGSELKTLLVHGGIEKQVDLSALDAYLTFGYVPEDFCIYENVHKLGPAHFLIFKDGEVSAHQYWDFNYGGPNKIRTEAEYTEVLREKISDAVNVRMISEVPLGAFLSGGIDSSTVVAMMSKLSSEPVKTFSIGFNEDSFDELKYARVAAKHFGTEHHEFTVSPDLIDIVDELVWHFDEPFADTSALPTYIVSKMAREFVTVALSGDGGDELFAGYGRYAIDKKRNGFGLLPKPFRKNFLQRFSHALPQGTRGKNYLYNVSLDPIDRYIDSVSHFNGPHKNLLYSKEFRARLDDNRGAAERRFQSISARIPAARMTDRLLYLDSKTYLPGDILTKVDRMSMANSLEVRAPLLDHELIEFVTSIPTEMKIRGANTKYVLKKAMEGIISPQILHREKQGFGMPINEWINDQLNTKIQDDLSDRRTIERGYFEHSYIQSLLREHSSKRRDNSYAIWVLWMLELWHRKFLDERY